MDFQRKHCYEGPGITGDKEIIAYCRIGERSSHTWFVLSYLLGYPNVRNYDGSGLSGAASSARRLNGRLGVANYFRTNYTSCSAIGIRFRVSGLACEAILLELGTSSDLPHPAAISDVAHLE
jgi:hypothetical protein